MLCFLYAMSETSEVSVMVAMVKGRLVVHLDTCGVVKSFQLILVLRCNLYESDSKLTSPS